MNAEYDQKTLLCVGHTKLATLVMICLFDFTTEAHQQGNTVV